MRRFGRFGTGEVTLILCAAEQQFGGGYFVPQLPYKPGIPWATKPDFNLQGTVKRFRAAQETGRGKAAHGQHTYCITPG
jgi:hypothetical protein